jgi:hypothetical protein
MALGNQAATGTKPGHRTWPFLRGPGGQQGILPGK